MLIFTLILQIIILILLISMVYSLSQIRTEYHRKITDIACTVAMFDNRLQILERKIKSLESNNDDD